MMANDRIAAALVALLDDHGGAWQGTAGDLLALLPGVAPDATRLARLLGNAGADLAAAGVTVERHRQAGTGRRVLRLAGNRSVKLRLEPPADDDAVTLAPPSLLSAAGSGADDTVTLSGGSLRTANKSEPASREADMDDAVTLPVVAADDPIALIFGPWVAAALRGGG